MILVEHRGGADSITTTTISLPDDRLLQLKETAARFNVTPEELVRVSIEELLAHPDDVFKRATDYILAKNTDLYRRLA